MPVRSSVRAETMRSSSSVREPLGCSQSAQPQIVVVLLEDRVT